MEEVEVCLLNNPGPSPPTLPRYQPLGSRTGLPIQPRAVVVPIPRTWL